MESPECPVCLQPFDGDSTIPRVLPCGHSACETCLAHLPKPFPTALRCPACTQLVKYPHPQGPTALPKNIDLLRLVTNNSPPNPTKVLKNQLLPRDFIPNLWSNEFYCNWKDWVVPSDAVLLESGEYDGGLCYGKVGRVEEVMPMRCLLKEKQKVSLLKVGSFSNGDDGEFNYSYVAKIMWVLFLMRDGEREELGLLLRASLRGREICPMYGFWYNEADKGVFLVCERYGWRSLVELNLLEEMKNDVYGFATIGMAICEAVSGLHTEGLTSGCLAPSCFDIDHFGHAYVDFNEVVMMGGRIHRMIVEPLSAVGKSHDKGFEMGPEDEGLKMCMFVSPEILLELLQKKGIDSGSGNLRPVVGHGSDVWSLACVLLWLLVGKPFVDGISSYQSSLAHSATNGSGSNFNGLHTSWLENVVSLLDCTLCSEFSLVKDFFCTCLDFDPEMRPPVLELWKCIRGLISKPRVDVMVSLEKEMTNVNKGHCILLGELCQSWKGTGRVSEILATGGLQKEDENGIVGDKVEELTVERDIIVGLSGGHVKYIDLKGHLDSITGLAIGGMNTDCAFGFKNVFI